ncbi:hypothetical protein CASFOL_006145 [Castilleja foliolosa]|uniref:Uncharacterized protein n=1 Tax=Castilleja foliolosa TaxID=1961234 RepID=A0ABD3E6G0_9LAMI
MSTAALSRQDSVILLPGSPSRFYDYLATIPDILLPLGKTKGSLEIVNFSDNGEQNSESKIFMSDAKFGEYVGYLVKTNGRLEIVNFPDGDEQNSESKIIMFSCQKHGIHKSKKHEDMWVHVRNILVEMYDMVGAPNLSTYKALLAGFVKLDSSTK